MGRSARIAHITIIILLFGASVAIRAPHLNRPLSDMHKWLTAHTLISLDNLADRGAFRRERQGAMSFCQLRIL